MIEFIIPIMILFNLISLTVLGKTRKRLIEAENLVKTLGAHKSTPVKELAADFRDFVQSIDGHVSPEVDAAIKKLEEEQKPKALPAPHYMATPVKKPRSFMTIDIWNIFVADFKAAGDSDEMIGVIKRWGKKYIIALDDQIELIGEDAFDEYDREDLRDYFDDNHGSQLLSIGKPKNNG